jgi:nucleoid-associated protein YgaU
MARRKKIATKKVRASKQRAVEVTKASTSRTLFKWGESYTSLLLGVVVVIIGVLFVGSIIKSQNHTQQISSTSTTASPTEASDTITPTPETNQVTYTVQEGDDLWHISEKFYKTGYNYTEIAKVNHITNPSSIYKNDKLIIPSITPTITPLGKELVTPTPTNQQVEQPTQKTGAITGNTYTVISDDDLWDIALRAYGDGYRWTDIAKANNLYDPGLIFSGNVLKIPR